MGACGAQFPPHFIFCAPAARNFRAICFWRACGAQFPPHFFGAFAARKNTPIFGAPGARHFWAPAARNFPPTLFFARLRRAISPPFCFGAPATCKCSPIFRRTCGAQESPHLFGAPVARNFPSICFFTCLRRAILPPFVLLRLRRAIFPPCFRRACGAQKSPHFFWRTCGALFLRACGVQFPPYFVFCAPQARNFRAIIFWCAFGAQFSPIFCAPAVRSFPLFCFRACSAQFFLNLFLRISARLRRAILSPLFWGGWICRGAHKRRRGDTACGARDWAVLAPRVAESVRCVDGLARADAASGEDPLATGLGLPPRQPDRAQLATAINRISATQNALGGHLRKLLFVKIKKR